MLVIATPTAQAERHATQESSNLVTRYDRILQNNTAIKELLKLKKETCPSLRKAIRFYRAKTWERQDLVGDSRSPTYYPERKRYRCAYKRHVLTSWKGQAFAYRKIVAKFLAIPVGEAALRAYINDDCLEEIIDRESAGTWSPTVRNYRTGIAYGLPQAVPGKKMASAGADWATNPKTQIKWMIGYVNSKYGGSCEALAFHNANGWY